MTAESSFFQRSVEARFETTENCSNIDFDAFIQVHLAWLGARIALFDAPTDIFLSGGLVAV